MSETSLIRQIVSQRKVGGLKLQEIFEDPIQLDQNEIEILFFGNARFDRRGGRSGYFRGIRLAVLSSVRNSRPNFSQIPAFLDNQLFRSHKANPTAIMQTRRVP